MGKVVGVDPPESGAVGRTGKGEVGVVVPPEPVEEPEPLSADEVSTVYVVEESVVSVVSVESVVVVVETSTGTGTRSEGFMRRSSDSGA